MERLTQKHPKIDGYMPKYDNGVYIQYMNKLGQLEDIEEELGCPLKVRDRALKQDEIFYVEKNQTKMIRVIAMNYGYINNGECVLNCLANGIWFCLPTKDYQKTWWLKKDKSE